MKEMRKYKRRGKYRYAKKILCISLCLLFGLLTAFSSFAFAPKSETSNEATDGIFSARTIEASKYNDDPISSGLTETEGNENTEPSLPENSEDPEETESSDISEPESDNPEESSDLESSDPDASEEDENSISLMFTNVSAGTLSALTTYMTTANADYIISLTANITLTAPIVVPSGTNIVLLSDDLLVNRTLSMNYTGTSEYRHFTLNGGNVAVGPNVILDGKHPLTSAPNAGGVEVWSGGTFLLAGGAITNCKTPLSGGAIAVFAGGSLLLESGGISNCVATQSGGGIYYDSAANVEMKDITISGCVAHSGAGICINNQSTTFKLGQNSVIIDCTTVKSPGTVDIDTPNGAGVSVMAGTFSMQSNSKITDCISASHAGGIVISEGATVIIGTQGSASDTPLISGCQSTKPSSGAYDGGNGGGISSAGTVYLYSGSIEDCTSVTNGGGIYMDNPVSSTAQLYMTGGSILRCSSNQAGGVFICYAAAFRMSGGTIGSCTSTSNGGGVSVVGGDMVMETDLSVPTIQGCVAGGSGAAYWAGKGGGIAVTYGGSVSINGGLINGCEATADGDYRIVGSGGGIFLDATSTANVMAATISNCKASFYGGGISTIDYTNLTTTADVYFSGNSAIFYRKPANDVTQYTCSNAGSVSLTESELGIGMLYPLNNYDIIYMSYSAIYYGNGGTDSGTEMFEIVKETKPFTEDNGQYVISDSFSDPYTVLHNSQLTNNLFEFTKTGSDFGTWASTDVYIPDYQYFVEYTPGLIAYVGKYSFLSQSPPKLELYALWTKDVIVTKTVKGDYGDLSKKFEIEIKLIGAWGDSSYLQTEDLLLASGESQTIPGVYESSILNVQEKSAEGYTVAYSSGTVGVGETDPLNSWISIAALYGTGAATVNMINTFETAVESGISFINAQTALIFVGAFGVVCTSCLVVYTSRKRRRQ